MKLPLQTVPKPKFDAKAYRNTYRKSKYLKKAKISDYRPYSNWKSQDGNYLKFTCSICTVEKDSTAFYITSLRYCKLISSIEILRCKKCYSSLPIPSKRLATSA